VLREGDLVGLDFGAVKDGFFGDAARTVAVGSVTEAAIRLVAAARDALAAGIAAALPGAASATSAPRCRRSSSRAASPSSASSWPRDRAPPARAAARAELRPGGTGSCSARGWSSRFEPMVNAGGPEVEVMDDGWTAVTADAASRHFEHTVAITENGPEILTLPDGPPLEPGGAG